LRIGLENPSTKSPSLLISIKSRAYGEREKERKQENKQQEKAMELHAYFPFFVTDCGFVWRFAVFGILWQNYQT